MTLKATKNCIMCGIVKAGSEFYVVEYTTNQGKRSTRYEPRCKECARARRRAAHAGNRDVELRKMRDRRAKNGDKYRANLNKFRAENREHVLRQRIVHQQRRTAAKYGKEDRAMIERVLSEARIGDRYVDAYTGDLIDKPVVDHIVPLSKGGEHAYENLCVTSRAMNSSKHSRSLLVWLALR